MNTIIALILNLFITSFYDNIDTHSHYQSYSLINDSNSYSCTVSP
ncbi:hypothetical protein BN1805_03645 [Proteus vulgaris]|nr:hypothetical protein BN1805_03645 [Proteus vulgaris]